MYKCINLSLVERMFYTVYYKRWYVASAELYLISSSMMNTETRKIIHKRKIACERFFHVSINSTKYCMTEYHNMPYIFWFRYIYETIIIFENTKCIKHEVDYFDLIDVVMKS